MVEEKSVPGELAKLIEEKKLNEFRLTYTDDESLYLVTGFGEQETGGYSISVNECYLTETSIVFDTTLIGPSKDETVQQKEPLQPPERLSISSAFSYQFYKPLQNVFIKLYEKGDGYITGQYDLNTKKNLQKYLPYNQRFFSC